MAWQSHYFKRDISEVRAVGEFKEAFKQVTQEMVEDVRWTQEEKEVMQLISENNDPRAIHRQIQLDNESNKKIADVYFMVLLNSLIRSKIQVPFKLPEKEISSWPNDYPIEQFAKDILKHKKSLSSSPVGNEIMKAASDYAVLYESTVGKTAHQTTDRSEKASSKLSKSSASSTFDNVSNTLGFLYGLSDGLLSTLSNPYPSTTTMMSESARVGYAAGIFAKAVFELGSLAIHLMK
ncbi:hypothetical protein [Legionella beliardensis]|nr:hypothetical protein [Legionella beliardensis]